jgi:inhibitor of cysteine peptidase
MLRKIFSLLLASFILCGFSAAPKGPAQFTEADSGKTIEIKTGGSFDISLEGNPSTGYIWSLASKRSPVINQMGDPEFKPKSKLIGSGGISTFHFKAARPGKAALRLVYHRPWEKKKEPARTFQLNITVID